MRIDHEFSRIAGTPYGRRHIGAGGGYLKNCVCVSCKEAREAYVPPAPPVETFEEFWDATLEERIRATKLTWESNRRARGSQ